jgi:hypothetical protein
MAVLRALSVPSRKEERAMRSHWKDMDPVDDFVTQQTPGLKIYQKRKI